ncbi:hypothetical protein TrST_g2867 [Triparma strigata]|uniref:Amine oxidase domain-containing protein n=1 Tax=Triparma strigata TaxID=1606541 RepID=A0A9W6ZIL5_9STRA|nr:hypothetical protein TrST_g2867 [Triparma strigata]
MATIPTFLRRKGQLVLAFLVLSIITQAKSLSPDVIIVGGGLSGLTCGSLLSQTPRSVLLLESHDTVGGCAHTWTRKTKRGTFHFESGPSLYSGLSTETSYNPLKNVFDIIGESPDIIKYDRWGTVFPNGVRLAAPIGPKGFDDVLMAEFGTPEGRRQWDLIMERMKEVGEASQALTSMSLREDIGVLRTAFARYPGGMFKTLKYAKELNSPFSDIVEELNITDPFVLNWLDMLCFLLQGLPSAGTMNAVIGYMLQDWYRDGVVLDFPKGGSGGIVDALARGIEKGNGQILVNKHVEKLIVKDNRAVGVRLKNGEEIFAKQAVVCNLTPFAIRNLLPDDGSASDEAKNYVAELCNTNKEAGGVENLKSFIHLHAAIDAEGLPEEASADFPAQWAVIRDWDLPEGVEAERNIVLCTMTSLIDDTLAPKGTHVLHAYVPATEPYEDWKGLDRTGDEYKKKKADAADFLWKAIEEYVPNARERAIDGTVQIGTPLTHERFLRRAEGAYGPRAIAGDGGLPGHKAKGIDNLWFCGDYFFPGIGVPACASGGAIVANSLVTVKEHNGFLDKIKLPV